MTQIPIGRGERALAATVFDSPAAMGEHVAQMILAGAAAARAAGRRYLLGCPGGRTPMVSYQALGRQAAAARADLSGVVIVMMDDYLVPAATGFAHCPDDAHYSCRRAAREDITGVINRGLPAAGRIPPAQVWFPDPAQPEAYDERLRAEGGIALFLTASGASDGHVAFNTPGSALDSNSRVVPLPDSTRRDNLRSFPLFKGLADVPAHGVTIGLGTIQSLSRQVILLVHGADKRDAVKRLAECSDFDAAWPASFIFRCRRPRIFLDREAMP